MNTAKAIQRLRQVIRRQHKALSTEHCYVFWLRRYMAALLRQRQDYSFNGNVVFHIGLIRGLGFITPVF